MMRLFGIALGAGVTSAVLFAVTTTASPLALVVAYLAPLPLMIVGLGFTHPVGAAAALIGSGAVGLSLGPTAGGLFLIALGLPAWYLARYAVLSRPATSPTGASAVDPAAWSTVPGLVLRLAALAAFPVLVAGVGLIWRFGGYEAAVQAIAARLAPMFGREALPIDVALGDLVRLAPIALTASGTLMLAINLWLAARTVKISDRLPRPWPNLPDALRLPRFAAAGLAVLVAGLFLPAPFSVAAGVPAAALGVVFAFEGLAAAHVLTRGLAARPAALAAIYLAVVLLMPWPLFALALLGCIDCLAPQLRRGAGIRITKLPTRRQ